MEIAGIGMDRKMFTEFPPHRHGHWEVLLNTEGCGQLLAEGEAFDFCPGTVAVIPPYVQHRKESKDGFRDCSIFIKNFRHIGREGVKVFQDDAEGSVAKIFAMTELFYEKQTTPSGEQSIVNVLGDLLYQVLAFFYRESQNKDIRLEGVLELMHKNVSNPDFDLAGAITASGYSMGYFRKIFKELTGQSPVTHMQQLRITHAKSLFEQYGKSRTVKEVSYQCGFTDPLYFSRVFRRLEGISPQAYLQSLSYGLTPENIQLLAMDTPEDFL